MHRSILFLLNLEVCARALLLTLSLGAVSATAQTVIVNETFTDGNRGMQKSPHSLNWHCTEGHTRVGVADGWLTISSGVKSANSVVANFPYVELKEGQSLRLALQFRPEVKIVDSTLYMMMVGLFDSNGEPPIAKDKSDPAPLRSRGYAVPLNYNGTPPEGYDSGYFLRVLKRNKDEGPLITSSRGYSLLANRQNEPVPVVLESGLTYDLELIFTRESSQTLRIEGKISGVGLREDIHIITKDTHEICHGFDTIALTSFFNNSGAEATGGFTSVSYSSIRLEPYL